MANFDIIKYNSGDPPASVNDALLDEFFSILAGITMRLVADNPSPDKDSKQSKSKGVEP
jgi:hypothetical protein